MDNGLKDREFTLKAKKKEHTMCAKGKRTLTTVEKIKER